MLSVWGLLLLSIWRLLRGVRLLLAIWRLLLAGVGLLLAVGGLGRWVGTTTPSRLLLLLGIRALLLLLGVGIGPLLIHYRRPVCHGGLCN